MQHEYESSLQIKIWQGLAGEYLGQIMQDPETAVGYLSHSIADVRIAAVSILCSHFKLEHELIDRLTELSCLDADLHVRCFATARLAEFYAKDDAPRAMRLLADVVKNAALDEETRLAYYSYLLTIANCYSRLDELSSIPECIDWVLIDRLLNDA